MREGMLSYISARPWHHGPSLQQGQEGRISTMQCETPSLEAGESGTEAVEEERLPLYSMFGIDRIGGGPHTSTRPY